VLDRALDFRIDPHRNKGTNVSGVYTNNLQRKNVRGSANCVVTCSLVDYKTRRAKENNMPRAMTPVEKQRFKGYFPSLDVNQAVVSGEMSRIYNCISWTLGITDRWVWPGATIQAFDSLYASAGFVRAGNGPIAVWGHSFAQMTHGCISGPAHGSRWESK